MSRRPAIVSFIACAMSLALWTGLSPTPGMAETLDQQCRKAEKEIRTLRNEVRSLGKMWKIKGVSKKLNRAKRLCADGDSKAAGELLEKIKQNLRDAIASAKGEESPQPSRW
ncbi:MAG: hypothetical protein ISR48_04170 [Alphaproteobacteria bacterium]|nr:hypothetical protein [Alphaproteobacteria bacterium]